MRPALTPIVHCLAEPLDDPLYAEAIPCLDDELQTVAVSRAVELLHVRCAALAPQALAADEIEHGLERLSQLGGFDAGEQVAAELLPEDSDLLAWPGLGKHPD